MDVYVRRAFWLESKTCTYVRMYTLLLGGGDEYVRTYIKPVQDLRTYVRALAYVRTSVIIIIFPTYCVRNFYYYDCPGWGWNVYAPCGGVEAYGKTVRKTVRRKNNSVHDTYICISSAAPGRAAMYTLPLGES